MARTEQEDLDALRRRLYRPGASDEDRQRYDELSSRVRADAPTTDVALAATAEEGERAPSPSRSAAVRAPLVVVGLLAVLAVAGVLSIPPATTSTAAAPTTAPAPRSRPDPSQATPVAVSAGGVAMTAQRFHGVGPAVVPLITGSAPPNGGRLVVVLTSDATAPLGWTAARWGSIGSGPSTPQVIASSPRQPRTGLGHPETTEYGGDPPADIAVGDPGSHAWELTVLILDPES